MLEILESRKFLCNRDPRKEIRPRRKSIDPPVSFQDLAGGWPNPGGLAVRRGGEWIREAVQIETSDFVPKPPL